MAELNVLHTCAVIKILQNPAQFENGWTADLKFDALIVERDSREKQADNA